MSTSRLLPMLAALGALAVVVAACALVAAHADEEARRPPATCAPSGCYCEAVATHGVRQPIDAWSSVAPALAGALVLALALGTRREGVVALARSRTPSAMLGLAACSIAVFSFHYHATLTWLGEWLDGVSLYLLAGFPIAWAIASAGRLRGGGFAAVYVSLAVLPAGLSWLVPELRKPAFVVLALVAVGVELVRIRRARTRTNGVWLGVALGCFVAAGIAWTLDWHRVVCDPDGPLQLHALWHLLSAPTILALHAYFASERAVDTDQSSRRR